MHVAAVPLLLIGLLASGCAGAAELAVRDADPEPTAAAAAAASAQPPAAHAAPSPVATTPNAEPLPFDSRWADEVRAVVATYESWGRVDDEARWAPYLCRIPRSAAAHVSESDHADTHGHKLYTLYAMDPEAYGAPPSAMGAATPLPGLSQVIVKESFSPMPLDEALDAKLGSTIGGGVGAHGLRPAEREGQRFVADERKGLFLMMKTSTPTEGTDAGWVYATVEPDMITVTAVGVIDACAGCHAEAGDGRLFGRPEIEGAPDPGRSNAVPL